MTLPVSGPISLSQIANEVGLSLPISINHPWLLKLINKPGLPVSFSDFYGKTGRYDGTLTSSVEGGTYTVVFSSEPFFGGQLYLMNGGPPDNSNLFFTTAPNWSGNIKAINNTTGSSCVMQKNDATFWRGTTGNILRPGQTDSITILPSN